MRAAAINTHKAGVCTGALGPPVIPNDASKKRITLATIACGTAWAGGSAAGAEVVASGARLAELKADIVVAVDGWVSAAGGFNEDAVAPPLAETFAESLDAAEGLRAVRSDSFVGTDDADFEDLVFFVLAVVWDPPELDPETSGATSPLDVEAPALLDAPEGEGTAESPPWGFDEDEPSPVAVVDVGFDELVSAGDESEPDPAAADAAESADPSLDGSAHATPCPVPTAKPTPSATASAPTRPTYVAHRSPRDHPDTVDGTVANLTGV